MRRGRGKGKKQNTSAREDRGSGEEEKIPAYRRRGRPQKPMKDDFEQEEEEEEEDEVEKMEVEEEEEKEEEDDESSVTSKHLKKKENEKNRKITNGSNTDINEEVNGLGSKSSTDDSAKSTSTGFRQNGSRRKSKLRRAAEAVVECNGV